MRIKKIFFLITSVLLSMQSNMALASNNPSYCPSDSTNSAIYTVKRGNLLPRDWGVSANWVDKNNPESKWVNPPENREWLENNIPEGQYRFYFSILDIPNHRLRCMYVKLEEKTGRGIGTLVFDKVVLPSDAIRSHIISPQGMSRWFKEPYINNQDSAYLMCGYSFLKVTPVEFNTTSCPFYE